MATLSFDRPNQIITILAPDTTITCQELYDKAKEYEDDLTNMDIGKVVDGEGKTDLGGSRQVGITLSFLEDWRIAFEARPGPTIVQCFVSDGNLKPTNAMGNSVISPTAFTQPIIQQDTSPALITTGGSALTATQATQLNELYLLQGLQSGSPMTVTPTSRAVTGVTQTISGDGETTSTVTRN